MENDSAKTGRSSESIIDDVLAVARKMKQPVFRGQAKSSWPLLSAAIRRIYEKFAFDPEILDEPDELSHLHTKYHRRHLLEPLPRMVSPASNLPDTDLQRLGMLQHLGAATGLIDFTEDPLVAIWFASHEHIGAKGKRYDGKVFVIDIDAPAFRDLNNSGSHDLGSLFSKVSYWHPHLDEFSASRVIAQRSVFLLGAPLIPEGLWKEVVVPDIDKKDIIDRLKDLGKSHEVLFRDLYGHAANNGPSQIITPPLQPRARTIRAMAIRNLKDTAVRAILEGRLDDSISAYSEYVSMEPNTAEPYLLRGSAYAAQGEHQKAIHEYGIGLEHIQKPTPYGQILPSRIQHYYESNTYYNRANSKAALGMHKEAAEDYRKAKELWPVESTGKATILYNQANSYFDLQRFEEAAEAYREADENGDVREAIWVGYGNCMVALCKLDEAEEAFREGARRDDATSSRHNLKSMAVIRQEIQEAEFELEWRSHSLHIKIKGQPHVESQVSNPQSATLRHPQGNTGNRGIFGEPGGKGYPGKPAVVVVFDRGDPDSNRPK